MGAPYIYDISRLRVNVKHFIFSGHFFLCHIYLRLNG